MVQHCSGLSSLDTTVTTYPLGHLKYFQDPNPDITPSPLQAGVCPGVRLSQGSATLLPAVPRCSLLPQDRWHPGGSDGVSPTSLVAHCHFSGLSAQLLPWLMTLQWHREASRHQAGPINGRPGEWAAALPSHAPSHPRSAFSLWPAWRGWPLRGLVCLAAMVVGSMLSGCSLCSLPHLGCPASLRGP